MYKNNFLICKGHISKYVSNLYSLFRILCNKSNLEIIENNKIGNYARFGEYDEYTNVELEDDLETIEKMGYKKTITFDPTSLNNKLVSQFFEINDSDIKKLDIVDYGFYRYNNFNKQAFFIGKVLVDDNGTQTFVRLFTIVFE